MHNGIRIFVAVLLLLGSVSSVKAQEVMTPQPEEEEVKEGDDGEDDNIYQREFDRDYGNQDTSDPAYVVKAEICDASEGCILIFPPIPDPDQLIEKCGEETPKDNPLITSEEMNQANIDDIECLKTLIRKNMGVFHNERSMPWRGSSKSLVEMMDRMEASLSEFYFNLYENGKGCPVGCGTMSIAIVLGNLKRFYVETLWQVLELRHQKETSGWPQKRQVRERVRE